MKQTKYFCFIFNMSLKCIMKALMCLLLLVALIFGIFYGVYRYNAASNDSALLKIGFVLPEDAKELSMIFSFANGTDALKGFCSLEKYDYDDAMEALESDELYMVLVIPDDFYDKSTQMEKAEFDIYIKGEPTVYELKFLSVLTSVERIMATTEGSIYAMYDGIYKYNVPVNVHDMENEIMDMYVEQFLGRSNYFDETSLSAFGEFSFFQYIFVSVFILCTLLSGVMYLSMYNKNIMKLERIYIRGKYQIVNYLGRIISIGLSYFAVFFIIAFLINLYLDYTGSNVFIADNYTYTALFIYSFVLSAFINFFCVLTNDSLHGRCIYIIITILLAVALGFFVPSVYLPDFLRSLQEVNYFSAIQAMLLNCLWGGDKYYYQESIISMVILIIPGLLIYRRRLLG